MGIRGTTHVIASLAGVAGVLVGCASSGAQGSPASLVTAYYTEVHDGNFVTACTYFDSEAKALFANFGTTCEAAIANEYSAEDRAKFKNIKVDESKIDMSTDVTVIPESAITFDGQESDDDDATVVKRDGKWYIGVS